MDPQPQVLPSRYELLCVGEMMKEIFLPFLGFPAADSTLVWDSYIVEFGGPALNISWYTTNLGLKALPVCICGQNDVIAVNRALAEAGLPQEGIYNIQTESDILVSLLDEGATHHYSFYFNGPLTRDPAKDLLAAYKPRYVVLCGSRHQAFRRLFQETVKTWPECFYIFNPSYATFTYSAEELEFLVNRAGLLFLNEGEADYVRTALRLSNLEEVFVSNSRILVTSKGRKGVLALQNGCQLTAPSYVRRRVVNPIGSGDALLSGIIYSLLRGTSLEDALHFGSALAASVVEDSKIRVRVTLGEVQERLRL